jgi:hypothetical protein
VPQVPYFFLKALTLVWIESKVCLSESLEYSYFLQVVQLFQERAGNLVYAPKLHKEDL